MGISAQNENFPAHGNTLHRGRMGWASTGFTPSGTPTVRYDASQITGLEDGDPVGTWSDVTDTGYDLTQGNADLKPTYKTNIQNGLPIVRFDGGDSIKNGDAMPGGTNKEGTIFATCANLTDQGATQTIYRQCEGNPQVLWSENANKCQVYSDVVSHDCGAELTGDNHCSIYWEHEDKGVLRVNGEVRLNTIDFTNTFDWGNDFALGSNTVGNAHFLTGDICEVIIYLSLEDPTVNDAGLMTKWGIE